MPKSKPPYPEEFRAEAVRAADGGVFAFGDAPFLGSPVPLKPGVRAIALFPLPHGTDGPLVRRFRLCCDG